MHMCKHLQHLCRLVMCHYVHSSKEVCQRGASLLLFYINFVSCLCYVCVLTATILLPPQHNYNINYHRHLCTTSTTTRIHATMHHHTVPKLHECKWSIYLCQYVAGRKNTTMQCKLQWVTTTTCASGVFAPVD